MKVNVFLLTYKRPSTFNVVLNSIYAQTVKPNEIYVINNNPDVKINFKDCININLSKNMGCRIRHAIALATDYDYCLFVDDDVKLNPKAIENFCNYAEKYPNSILGYYGRNIVPKEFYSLHCSNLFTNTEKEVDIILGMVHFCTKEHLLDSFKLEQDAKLKSKEDDIILSLSNNHYCTDKNYVIPYTQESSPVPLKSREKGISGEPGHLDNRKNTVKAIMEYFDGL